MSRTFWGSAGTRAATHALLASSPAIDSADSALAPSHDQRGYLRAGISDIGAFEYHGVIFRSSDMRCSGNAIVVRFEGAAGKTFRLERKLALTDLEWEFIPGVAGVTPATSGPTEIIDPNGGVAAAAFYRVRLLP